MPTKIRPVTGKLGIIAGGGSLPSKLVHACSAVGRPVFVVGIEGEADLEMLDRVPIEYAPLGAAGKILQLLHKNCCKEVVLAGPINRPSLAALRPDARGAKIVARLVTALGGDNSLLTIIIDELEKEGFKVVGAEEVLADLLAPSGCWGQHAPSDTSLADIRHGIEVIKVLGHLDIGQATIVQQCRVIGVEAAEGTDALISRCATLCMKNGPRGVLIKIKKPGQQQRADLPSIGVDTVNQAAKSGLAGIAVESGATLTYDRSDAISVADRKGLFLYGIDGLQ